MWPFKAASSTIGTQTVNNIWQAAYYIVVFLIVAGFAIYDVLKRRVPSKALVIFCTVALASPAVKALDSNSGIFGWISFLNLSLLALSGAVMGFVVLLAAAIASKGGNGVGGGDIKLAAVLGFIYGPSEVIGILLIASLLAIPAGLIKKRRSNGNTLRLPFVPFMAIGSLAVTLIKIM